MWGQQRAMKAGVEGPCVRCTAALSVQGHLSTCHTCNATASPTRRASRTSAGPVGKPSSAPPTWSATSILTQGESLTSVLSASAASGILGSSRTISGSTRASGPTSAKLATCGLVSATLCRGTFAGNTAYSSSLRHRNQELKFLLLRTGIKTLKISLPGPASIHACLWSSQPAKYLTTFYGLGTFTPVRP